MEWGWYIILLCVLLVYVLLYDNLREKMRVMEGYENKVRRELLFSRCDKYGVGGVLKEVFDENGIMKNKCSDSDEICKKRWDIYVPCGYTGVESELDKVRVSNDKQIIFGITGCDSIVSKNSLWNLFEKRYGRDVASMYVPETYVLSDDRQMDIFRKKYRRGNVYIMKRNVQRQQGLKLVRDMEEIMTLSSGTDGYRIVQELLMDPYCVGGRKINLRVYILILCEMGKMSAYVYNNGFIYYTPKEYKKNSLDMERNITVGYFKTREIYEKNPLTHEDLKEYMRDRGENYVLMFNNLSELVGKMMDAVYGSLCRNSRLNGNKTFQLFGADVAPNKDMKMQLIEVNKGPDMGAKDGRDGRLKKELQEDIFGLLGVIDVDRENRFRKVWSRG